MQPHLSLHYSSQAPIYGGLAAGWSLDIPTITLDTTHTALRQDVPVFRSSLGGGSDLVPVSESTPPEAAALC